jgi:hypothetical protein
LESVFKPAWAKAHAGLLIEPQSPELEQMKAALKSSIVLNLGLIGGLIYILANQTPKEAGRVSSTLAETGQLTQAVAVSTPPLGSAAEPGPFRWSQLESAGDYRKYVRNLRNIGCPEPTLRAIVTADVDVLYRQRRQELEKKLASLAGRSWSDQLAALNDEQAWKAEFQKLPDAEASEIADWLGLKSSAQVTAEEPSPVPATTPRSRHNQENTPILTPLVFQKVDLSTLNLNDQQRQFIEELRQNFADEIGGPDQDPNDPAYRERWQKAQPETDNLIKAMLGITVFENYQLAAEINNNPVTK